MKEIIEHKSHGYGHRIPQQIGKRLIMRLTATIGILATVILSVFAERSAAQRVSIHRTQASLEEVFSDIRKQTGYSTVIPMALLRQAEPITIKAEQAELHEVLAELHAQTGYAYVIPDGRKIIRVETVERVGERSESSPRYAENGSLLILAIPIVTGIVTDTLGNPLEGAGVIVVNAEGKKTTLQTVTNQTGRFFLRNVPEDASLLITYIGYVPQTIPAAANVGKIALDAISSELSEVQVNFGTGFQTIPKERATGSFVLVDSTLFNRRVGTNVLDRLEGVASGLVFNGNVSGRGVTGALAGSYGAGENVSSIAVWGRSTMYANPEPLIVVDNFPYTGDINNINPNDVDNVTILKDAAASSIWGARAGNGVIVITTKSGKKGAAPKITATVNTTIGDKPDLWYRPTISNDEYLEINRFLFESGLYNNRINASPRQSLPDDIEIRLAVRNGTLSAAEAALQIDRLRLVDYRTDIDRYFNRKSLINQSNLNISGGGNSIKYYFSASYDRTRSNRVGNDDGRLNLTNNTTFSFWKDRIELMTSVNFSSRRSKEAMPLGQATLYPYTDLVDESGQAGIVNHDVLGRSRGYVDTVGNGLLLDWQFRPFDELRFNDDRSTQDDYRLATNLKVNVFDGLDVSLVYQYNRALGERAVLNTMDTYYTRDLINRFAQIDESAGTVSSYPVPLGSIFEQRNNGRTHHSGRVQLTYSKTIREDHAINAFGGWEISDNRFFSRSGGLLYGYDERVGTSTPVDFVTSFVARPIGSRVQINRNYTNSFGVDRFISYFANASYAYRNRYTVSASARKDESNLFGVDANQKGVPLWSVGAAWDISGEEFYGLRALPYLKLRVTTGYSGNVDKSVSAYVTARTYRSIPINRYGAAQYEIVNPPNPDLTWEEVETTKLAMDFGLARGLVTGSVEWFWKHGQNLIGNYPMSAVAGVTTFRGNYADLQTRGMDVVLTTNNVRSPRFSWLTNVLFSYVTDKVTKYAVEAPNTGVYVSGGMNFQYPYVGKPFNSVFAYRWAGLDPQSGLPMGYLNGEPSIDYGQIRTTDIKYIGPGRPPFFGAIRNDFSYHDLSLSVNITYKAGFFFKPDAFYGSISAGSVGAKALNYAIRWQQPGDEQLTNTPSIAVLDDNRANFYPNNELIIEKGDHIRLQDVRLSYSLKKLMQRQALVRGAEVYAYANNLGLLWRANGIGEDPDYLNTGVPNPRTFALGFTLTF